MTDTIKPSASKAGVKGVEGGVKDGKEVVAASIPPNSQDFNNPSAISILAKDCLMRLKQICSILKSTRLDVTSYDPNIALPTMEDALARFRAWGSSIAAFQPGLAKTSLDSRLREAGGIRNRALKILEELQEYLHEATLIISGEKENNSWSLDDMSDDSEEDEEKARDVMKPATAEERTSDLEEIFSAIITSNASLMKLSMVIRSSPVRDDYLKAASKYSTYNPFPDINHVKEKHSSAKRSSDWLLERLGKAITRRRQFLLYRVEHHEKLSKWDDGGEKPKDKIDEKPEKTVASTKATTFFMGEILAPKPPSDTAVSFGSQTSYEATTAGGEGAASKLTVPAPPTFAFPGVPFEFGEPFQCPYCYTEQTVKNKAAWKKHVFRDLKPYVCTFKGCELRMFKSRNEWFAHELQNHRREWVCHFCRHDAFPSSATFSEHVSSAHPTILAGSQLEALALQSEEPVDTIPADACPLCNKWEETISIRHERQGTKMMLLNDGVAKAYVTTKQFRRHLGRHMEQLALFALPMAESDDLDDDSENTDDNSNASLPSKVSLSVIKEAEKTGQEKDGPVLMGSSQFTPGSAADRLVSSLTRCYELCNGIILYRQNGQNHENLDNLQAGLKGASSAIQIELHNLSKVLGSEIDVSDDPAWHELNRNIHEIEVVETRLDDIAYERNGDLPDFRDMLTTVKRLEDTSKRIIKDVGERLGSPPTAIPAESSSRVDQMMWYDRARDNRGVFLSLKEVSDIVEEGIKLQIPEESDYLNHYKGKESAGKDWESKAQEAIHADIVYYPQLVDLFNLAQNGTLPVVPETFAAVAQLLNKYREARGPEGPLADRGVVFDWGQSTPNSTRSVRSSASNISTNHINTDSKETTKIPASLVNTKVLTDLGFSYKTEADDSITILAALKEREIDEILRRSREITDSNFESLDKSSENSRNASTEKALAPKDLEATPSISNLTTAEMAQEMQRLSDQSNAATMETAQLKSQQAPVGRLSELEYPAKAAIAGLNEARANEEQSERRLRRSRTSSIESERLTRTHEGATDSSQYVLKESRKVTNEVEQGAGTEAFETLELPVADVERPTRTLRLKNIPSSTTVSNLFDLFGSYGSIAAARVLTHMNCGFVIYEHPESAIYAKARLNNQEIFPGAGPVLIDFAKTFPSGTSNVDNTELPSPSLNPAGSTLDWEEEKEEEEDLRLSLGVPSGAQKAERNNTVKPERRAYTRMSRRDLSIETINRYELPYEIDADPNYVLIKRWVPEFEQDFLWKHTRKIREKRLAEAASNRKGSSESVPKEPPSQMPEKESDDLADFENFRPGILSMSSAGAQETKEAQHGFIRNLYSMLEDKSTQHLISWSDSGESFLVFPSDEFLRVLSQYFKHMNFATFVRQLNKYGFHKVNDLLRNGSSGQSLWEFKHKEFIRDLGPALIKSGKSSVVPVITEPEPDLKKDKEYSSMFTFSNIADKRRLLHAVLEDVESQFGVSVEVLTGHNSNMIQLTGPEKNVKETVAYISNLGQEVVVPDGARPDSPPRRIMVYSSSESHLRKAGVAALRGSDIESALRKQTVNPPDINSSQTQDATSPSFDTTSRKPIPSTSHSSTQPQSPLPNPLPESRREVIDPFTLFVGNLPLTADPLEIDHAFGRYGTIQSLRIPADAETGQCKGFAYVTFASANDATAALEAMNNTEFGGRPLRLDYAAPRPSRKIQ